MDHLFGINLESLFPHKWNPNIINNIKHVYKAKLVIVKFKWPNKGAFKPIKLDTSNWLKGDKINIEDINMD